MIYERTWLDPFYISPTCLLADRMIESKAMDKVAHTPQLFLRPGLSDLHELNSAKVIKFYTTTANMFLLCLSKLRLI